MHGEVYEAYRSICHALELAPVSLPEYRRAITNRLEQANVVRVGQVHHTWILIRDDSRDGCSSCLRPVASFIEHFYSGNESHTFDDDSATQLLTGLHALHNLSIAVTNAYDMQNWSCVVAASDCPQCASKRSLLSPPMLIPTGPEDTKVPWRMDDTDGQRSMSPEAFVRHNRWAFGFAAVVGNPVPAPSAEPVSLVNAPIRTSVDVDQCEIAGGKGLSLEQALASCLGEAFERYALASATRQGVTVGSQSEVAGAIDVAHTFGFPVLDAHPSINRLTSSTRLEWMSASDLGKNDDVHVPVNFALCPYSGGSQAAIVAGSTNGAACGATQEDARAQALREIVERDAFWYYARTGAAPIHLDLTTLPSDLADAMRSYDGTFTVTLLPNPFMAPVANVAFVTNSCFTTRSARGSGHASTVLSSVWRAFAECVQMLWSLDSGIEVDPVSTDMRSLWFSGQAAQAMPNFFAATDTRLSLSQAGEHFVEDLPSTSLIASATAQGLTVLEIPLVEEAGFAVTKVLLSGASVSDALSFSSCTRFEDFAALMAHGEPGIQYRGSLFM